MGRVRTPAAKHQLLPSPVATDGALDHQSLTLALIQALIPLGLRSVELALQHEVAQLAGARYARDGGEPGLSRWGTQRGSVYVAD